MNAAPDGLCRPPRPLCDASAPSGIGDSTRLHSAAVGRSYPPSSTPHHLASLGGPSPSPLLCVHILLTNGCSASEARQVEDEALVVKMPPQLGMWSTGTPHRPLRRSPTLPAVHMSNGGAPCPRANALRCPDEAVPGRPAQPGPEQRACAIGRGPEERGPTPPRQPGQRGRIGERSDRYSAEGRGACLIRNNVQLFPPKHDHSRDTTLDLLLSFLITQKRQKQRISAQEHNPDQRMRTQKRKPQRTTNPWGFLGHRIK